MRGQRGPVPAFSGCHYVCRTEAGELMDFELRVATPDDVDATMQLETSTFETDAWSAESMSSELASEHTYYLFAFDSRTPELLAGNGGLLAAEDSGEGDIQTLAVAPSARRQGLG